MGRSCLNDAGAHAYLVAQDQANRSERPPGWRRESWIICRKCGGQWELQPPIKQVYYGEFTGKAQMTRRADVLAPYLPNWARVPFQRDLGVREHNDLAKRRRQLEHELGVNGPERHGLKWVRTHAAC